MSEAYNGLEGVTAFPSGGNFLMLETTEAGVPPEQISQKLAPDDYYVRSYPPFKGFEGRNFTRVTIGKPNQNNHVFGALKTLVQN